MSEKNLGGEKQPNKIEGFYHWLVVRFPEGHLGAGNAIPIVIDGNRMELIIYKPENNIVSFGLFLPGHKYARKNLMIDGVGQISEDTSGIIPDFDRAENESEIFGSNEQITTMAMETLKKHFPDN